MIENLNEFKDISKVILMTYNFITNFITPNMRKLDGVVPRIAQILADFKNIELYDSNDGSVKCVSKSGKDKLYTLVRTKNKFSVESIKTYDGITNVVIFVPDETSFFKENKEDMILGMAELIRNLCDYKSIFDSTPSDTTFVLNNIFTDLSTRYLINRIYSSDKDNESTRKCLNMFSSHYINIEYLDFINKISDMDQLSYDNEVERICTIDILKDIDYDKLKEYTLDDNPFYCEVPASDYRPV